MLNKENKRRIREEERFRREVKKKLAAQESQRTFAKKILAFFNTPLGIWFLSSVALGLLGWGYGVWQSSQKDAEQIDKIDAEIEARLNVAIDYSIHQTDSRLYPANVLLLPPGQERMIQEEFANRNLKSLLFELLALLRKKQYARIDVLRAQNDIRNIESDYLNRELKQEERDKFRERVQTIIELRWTGVQWFERHSNPYLDWFVLLIFPLILILGLFIFVFYPLFKRVRGLVLKHVGRRKVKQTTNA